MCASCECVALSKRRTVTIFIRVEFSISGCAASITTDGFVA